MCSKNTKKNQTRENYKKSKKFHFYKILLKASKDFLQKSGCREKMKFR